MGRRRAAPRRALGQVCREAAAAGESYGAHVARTEYPVEVAVPESAEPARVRPVALCAPEGGTRETRRSGQIRAMREAGLSVGQIARALGISLASVYRNMRAAGIPTERDAAREARGGDPAHGPEIRALAEQGKRPVEIAGALGLHPTTVYAALRVMGIGTGRPRTDEAERRRRARRVLELLAQGMGSREIARALGISVNTVYVDLLRARGQGAET